MPRSPSASSRVGFGMDPVRFPFRGAQLLLVPALDPPLLARNFFSFPCYIGTRLRRGLLVLQIDSQPNRPTSVSAWLIHSDNRRFLHQPSSGKVAMANSGRRSTTASGIPLWMPPPAHGLAPNRLQQFMICNIGRRR
jgi:hypothetical protein